MRALKTLGNKIMTFFFPDRCVYCGALVTGGANICESCSAEHESDVFTKRIEARVYGGKSVLCRAPFTYDGSIKQSIQAFKFRKRFGYLGSLAREMYRAVPEGGFDIIAFVPMGKKKKRKRGYDQSELLARRLSGLSGIPVLTALERTDKQNLEQHLLSARRRKENVRGMYRVVKEVRNKRILLIDDISTSGATLGECAGILFQAGAVYVECVCAAVAI